MLSHLSIYNTETNTTEHIAQLTNIHYFTNVMENEIV